MEGRQVLCGPREGGGFVTGATMANFSSLAAGRNAILGAVGWDVERDGLYARLAREQEEEQTETPDQAVVWAYALGLHEEAEEVLERSLEDAQKTLELPVIGAQHAPNLIDFLHSRNIDAVDGPEDLAAAMEAAKTAGVLEGRDLDAISGEMEGIIPMEAVFDQRWVKKLDGVRVKTGESIRAFPLSNWTELDIWQYIYLENIPIVPLYYSKVRPVVERDGMLILMDDERIKLLPGEEVQMKSVRFRTLGCYPLTGAVESDAATLPEIIQEMLLTRTSERQGRLIDHDQAGSMEKKKQEGYF